MPEVFSSTTALPSPSRRGRDLLSPLAVALLLLATAIAAGRQAIDLSPFSGAAGDRRVAQTSSVSIATSDGLGVTAAYYAESLWLDTAGGAEASSTVVVERRAAQPQVATTAETPPAPAVEQAPRVAAPAAAAAPPAAAAPTTPAERWRAEGFIFEMEGQEWDQASITNVDAALSLLPASVRARIGNRALGPIHVIVNTQGRTLSGKAPYGRAANFFSTNEGRNELVLYPGQSVATIIHELGHAYNLRTTPAGRYALVLLDPEMASFMAATGWRVLSSAEQVRAAVDQTQVSYAYDGGFTWPRLSHMNPLEDFANSFAQYFLDPARLSQASPARYDWFAGAFR
jgi:hypothetical protein